MSASQRRKGERGEWREVVSLGGRFSERYQVNQFGEVRAHAHARSRGLQPCMLISQHKDNSGYLQVILWLKRKPTTVKVHRLVADAFLGQRKEGQTVNHIDADKTNNCAWNLEYLTNIENCRHAYRTIEQRSAVVVCGERMSISEAVDRHGVPGITAKTVRRRVRRLKWPIEKALAIPTQPTGRPRNGQIRA
jgi:hypothetical protein